MSFPGSLTVSPFERKYKRIICQSWCQLGARKTRNCRAIMSMELMYRSAIRPRCSRRKLAILSPDNGEKRKESPDGDFGCAGVREWCLCAFETCK